MNRKHKTLLACASLCAMLLPVLCAQASAQTSMASARVIVKYKADSTLLRKDLPTATAQSAAQAKALGKRTGLALTGGAAVADRAHVVFANGMSSDELAQRLAAESDIEYAVVDGQRKPASVPNDPLYSAGPPIVGSHGGPVAGQWYLRPQAGSVQASINVEPAWDLVAGGVTVTVAVLDTGVRFDHPDLKRVEAGGQLLPGYDMISDVQIANDGDGRDPDPSDPGDWITDAESQSGYFAGCAPDNSSWHGTQVSGVIGALTDNGIGMAGVARNVRILPVRVLGKCGGFDSDIIAGMRWAVGLSVPGVPANPNPAKVLNLSLGGIATCSSAYVEAIPEIKATGAVIVVAAGNEFGHTIGSPANCAGVVAVAGLNQNGTKVFFSSLGNEVSISAPGGNCVNYGEGIPCLYPILTTANSGTTIPVADSAGGSIYTDSFNASLGTSFSTPLVAGTAALILSVRPNLTPDEVLAKLQASARPFPTTGSEVPGESLSQCLRPVPIEYGQFDQLECYCTTTTCGSGMLDASAAVLAAVSEPARPPKVVVTEFFHPQFFHYFYSADPAETAAMSALKVRPWYPTGLTFNAWASAGDNITNVCRFFGTFASSSSHYFTNDPNECPGLQDGGVWMLETPNAFYMSPSPTGTCPTETTPLYRVYNNAAQGAPNYRLTIDLTMRQAQINNKWTPSGNGPLGVVGCVPL